MSATILCGDSLEVMRTLPDNSIDAVVCDPPYALGFMNRDWDLKIPGPEYWAEAMRVAKPGAMLVAFGGTRMHHRLMVAIEDSGWELRDVISGENVVWRWYYGSGFPKNLDVSKAVDAEMFQRWLAANPEQAEHHRDLLRQARELTRADRKKRIKEIQSVFQKLAGTERKVIGTKFGVAGENLNDITNDRETVRTFDDDGGRGVGAYGTGAKQVPVALPVTAPATPEAEEADGWGTALKPSWEPIVVARKPLVVPAVDVVQAVERLLAQNGFERIRWKERPAKPAEKKKRPDNSTSTEQPPTAATSARSAERSGPPSTEQETSKKSGGARATGTGPTEIEAEIRLEDQGRSSEKKCLPHTEAGALAAEKQSQGSSLSTTLAAEETSTEIGFGERSTQTCEGDVSRLDFASSAGIAIALLDSTDSALTIEIEGTKHIIRRLDDGSLVWPDGVQKTLAAKAMTVAECFMEHGTGALNIDGCRIGTGDGGSREGEASAERTYGLHGPKSFSATPGPRGGSIDGRWPANLILCHMPECSELCVPECPVFLLDEQSGPARDGWFSGESARGMGFMGAESSADGSTPSRSIPGGNGASSFFYTAKASRSEREAGLHGRESRNVNDGRVTDIDNPYQRGDTQRKNTHTTVKPIAIMRWLVRLVCKRGGTVLDPFCGSGTTGIACKFEGMNFIGIDLEEEHVEIARKRIAQASLDAGGGTVEDADEVGGPAQLGLFVR